MAFVVKDRVKVTTTTTGTSDFTLGSASLGFQNFSVIGDGNVTYYAATDAITGDWEVGIGTYTTSGPTLTRTTVLESSAGGSKVSFSAGSKDVFVTYPAERAVYLDTAGSAVTVLDIGTLGVTTANITTANITSGTISTAPTSNTDIVNKQYADAIASGIHFHEAVELATTAALPANTYNNGTSGVGATLTANANGALSVDSTVTVVGYRVLVKNEATQANNGVYTVTQVGTAGTPYILTRATDFDTAGTGVDQIDEGDFFLVTSGTANANTAWVQQTAPPITVGTTAIVFQQFSAPITYTAGTGLNESPAFTFNIANTGTPGTYGSASNVPVFVTNAQGQVTSVTNTGIAIASGAVSGLAASATTDTTNAANITSGTLPSGRISGSYTGLTGTGALAAGSLATGFTAVSAPLGGTGQTSYAVGDFLFADTTTSLAKLADVAVGNALISGGVGSAPSYGKIGLATHVSGTLPVANGGTGVTSSTGSGSNVLSDSPTLVTPALGTPSALVGTNITGTATAFTASNVTTNANLTGAVTSVGNATSLGSFTSAQLAGALTDETGSGAAVFATSPTLVTPALGTPASGNLANCTFPTLNQNTSGSAATLTTGRTIAITGDLAYTSPSFNGSTNVTAAGTLATVNSNVGAFTNASITVNAKGLVTAASSGAASGTVTSVAATVPSFLSISGSPITSSGTLAISLSGNALPVANGGTGVTTTPSNGFVPIGNGTNYVSAALTAGHGIAIANASGSITISTTAYAAAILIVGGGGGGASVAGGGGAGGVVTGNTLLISGITYSAVVGGGGAGSPGNTTTPGTSGTSSSFTGQTTAIGGGGGGNNGANGISGGSGGGAGGSGTFIAGSGTSGQGFAGGVGVVAGAAGGGGGGAGAVGANSSGTRIAGNGGVGVSNSITGSAVFYGGGGGGGANQSSPLTNSSGGNGGGGGGFGNNTVGTSGTANTGGGGGGGGSSNGTTFAASGSGGSGVVIISVPTSKYTGTTTGSPTVTTSGSNTIIKFTSSGSYTA